MAGGWREHSVVIRLRVTLIVTLWLESRRPKISVVRVLVAFSSFLSMLLAPPVTAAVLYSADAAGGAAYVAILSGWGSICVFAVLATRKSDKETVARKRFEARFKDGPIGGWRGVRTGLRDVEQGCQIVFSPDGSGHYRLWGATETERGADAAQFRWNSVSERQIEVTPTIDEPSKRLEHVIAFYAGNSAKLLLSVAGAQSPQQSPWEIGWADFDTVHWPRFVAFDYVGEPMSGATPSQSSA